MMFRYLATWNSLIKINIKQCQSIRHFSEVAATKDLNAKNLQEAALSENCILVDEFDRVIGQSTKRDCHRVNPDGHIKLHRAFSVFLFNAKGDMLIQKRSDHKVNIIYWFFIYNFRGGHFQRQNEIKCNFFIRFQYVKMFTDYFSKLLHKCML